MCSRLLNYCCWWMAAKREKTVKEEGPNFEKEKFISTDQLSESTRSSNALVLDLPKAETPSYYSPMIISSPSEERRSPRDLIALEPIEDLRAANLEEEYSSVISPEHSYYSILLPKIQQLGGLFRNMDSLDRVDNDNELRVGYSISPCQKLSTFTYHFKLQCDFEAYEAITDNLALQKTLDLNIEECKKLMESPEGDTKLFYLSYKRILVISPRDFVYVRYTFQRGNEHWSVTTSVPYESYQNKVRGEILLTATRVLESQGGIQISQSSTVDLKMPLLADMARKRGISEIKKYVDRLRNHIATNSQ